MPDGNKRAKKVNKPGRAIGVGQKDIKAEEGGAKKEDGGEFRFFGDSKGGGKKGIRYRGIDRGQRVCWKRQWSRSNVPPPQLCSGGEKMRIRKWL